MTPDELLAQKKRLLDYYEDELRFLRKDALEFADRHPEQARGLKLRDGRRGDPHIERLLQGVALLAGRVRAKIDDEFPELTDALLGVLYPHLLAPIPSTAVVQFVPPPGSVDLVRGLTVPKHTELVANPIDEVACTYRTGYPITLWPVELTEATVRPRPFPAAAADTAPPAAKAVLVFQFRTSGGVPLEQTGFGAAGDPSLRVFLAGDSAATAALYEHLFNDAVRVVVRNPQTRQTVAADADPTTRTHPWVRPVGFEPDEALLPYPRQAFPGFRVLTEFFACRDKYLFADLGGWAAARAAGVLAGPAVELLVFLDRDVSPALQKEVSAATFRLGCSPVVNLFDRLAEVISLTHRVHEYPVVPHRQYPDGYEVYAVQEVVHVNATTKREVRYDPFYSFRHQSHDHGRAYWYARRRNSNRTVAGGGEDRPDGGTEVDLCFVDLGFEPTLPAEDQVLVRVTCTNRDLPVRLREAREEVRFDDRGQFGCAVRVVRAPTPTLRPPPRTGAYWRLVSHLSLNHLSLTDPEDGRDVLREYLRLYDFADPRAYPDLAAVNRQVVGGLERIASRPAVAFTAVSTGIGYARGVEIDVHLDKDKLEGVGAYLFAAVLDRFLALYTTVNSFTQLNYYTRQRGDERVKAWPPRTGTRPLL